MEKDVYDIILAPLITEKSTSLKDERKYVFLVKRDATKPEIRTSVEKIYGVKVEDVNTYIKRGKVRRRGRRFVPGITPNIKKAIVTLKKGSSIDFEKV